MAGAYLSVAACQSLYREHCHYWASTVRLLREHAAELLEAAEYARFVYGPSSSVHSLRLRNLHEVLGEQVGILAESVERADRGDLVLINEQVRRRVHELSEQVHHLDAAMRQAGPPIDDLPAGQNWPAGAAGMQGLNGAMEIFVREVVDLLTPTAQAGERPSLPPIARWRWIARYNFYPDSATACYPAGDLERMRLWPLLVHEFGHAAYNAGEDSDSENSSISTHWRELSAMVADLYTQIGQKLNLLAAPFTAEKLPSLRSHVAEYLCDMLGARTMGLAYLHAFTTYVGSDGDSPPMREPAPSGRRIVEWLTARNHPCAIIRYHLIVRTIRHTEGISDDCEQRFLAAMLGGEAIRKHHRAAAVVTQTMLDTLHRTLHTIVADDFKGSVLTPAHYARAEALLSAHGGDLHGLDPRPDARTIVLAATLKRLGQHGPSDFAGSYMTSIMRLLKSQEESPCPAASS